MHSPFVCCTYGTPDPQLLPLISVALDPIQIVQRVTLISRPISWGNFQKHCFFFCVLYRISNWHAPWSQTACCRQLLPSDARTQFLCSQWFVVLHHIHPTNQNDIGRASLVYFGSYTWHFQLPQEDSTVCYVNMQPILFNILSYWSSTNTSKSITTCN